MDIPDGVTEPLSQFQFLAMDGNQWILLLLSWAVISIVLIGAVRLLSTYSNRLSKRSGRLFLGIAASLFRRTRSLFLILVALYWAIQLADAGPRVTATIYAITVIAFAVQGILWANGLVSLYTDRYREQKLAADASAVTTMEALSLVSRIVIYSIIVLLALENLGVDITALVAGLGIGGIAVALAVQNILGDLFASMSIVLDKPFVVGDFLSIDEYLGSVEHIGLKTTRLRSLSGEQLIFSNSDLLNSRVRNYKRMFERRIVFRVDITYQTPNEKVPKVAQWLAEIVKSKDGIRFDRAHFAAFGDSALEYEVVYYVLDPDFNVYMDVQQEINLDILHRFAAEGIQFAYPTQTVLAVVSESNDETFEDEQTS